jgi:hypothetical protein
MKKRLSMPAASCLCLALALSGCASTGGSVLAPNPSAKRDYSVQLASAGAAKDFHLMRTEQLRPIPAGSTIGVIAGSSATLSLFIEADLEAKNFVVRQIDIYNLMTPRQKTLTDPSDDFVFINSLVGSIGRPDKENMGSVVEKLLPTDSLYVENQLAEHYLALVQDLKKMLASLNVDYLVVAGPAYKELSYALRIYDANKFDLVYTSLFVGSPKDWRSVVGVPQKAAGLSYDFDAGLEPTAFWEMAYSRYATDRIKVGGSVPATPAAKP